jgi:AraC-like DNA-binding protein
MVSFVLHGRGASLHAEPTGGVSTYGKDGFFAGSFLCLSALTDLAIIFDFNITGGKQAPGMIVIFQMALLSSPRRLSAREGQRYQEMITGKKRPESVVRSSGEFEAIYRRLEKQVRETQIYLNPDLTLSILARKTGIPARHLSSAVNSVSQCNISQWINGFRIERAKELLLNPCCP